MTKQDVANAVHQESLVVCTEKEYLNRVRRYLHEYAGECIDNDDSLRAVIALNEVKRLDHKFGSVEELRKLRVRAVKLGAIENYRDAARDLVVWPDLRKQMLDDLKKALDTHDVLQA